MYVQYSTWEVALKAVVVGTVGTYDERRYLAVKGSGSRYSRYVGGTYAGDGKMLPKFSRLMCEIRLDFVKLFCDAFK